MERPLFTLFSETTFARFCSRFQESQEFLKLSRTCPELANNPPFTILLQQMAWNNGGRRCSPLGGFQLNPPTLVRRLESCSYLSVPGRVSLPYPPAGRAHSVGRAPSASWWGVPAPSALLFQPLFFCSNFGPTCGLPNKPLFREICRFLVAPASIFDDFGSQNRSPRLTFSVFFQKR